MYWYYGKIEPQYLQKCIQPNNSFSTYGETNDLLDNLQYTLEEDIKNNSQSSCCGGSPQTQQPQTQQPQTQQPQTQQPQTQQPQTQQPQPLLPINCNILCEEEDQYCIEECSNMVFPYN